METFESLFPCRLWCEIMLNEHIPHQISNSLCVMTKKETCLSALEFMAQTAYDLYSFGTSKKFIELITRVDSSFPIRHGIAYDPMEDDETQILPIIKRRAIFKAKPIGEWTIRDFELIPPGTPVDYLTIARVNPRLSEYCAQKIHAQNPYARISLTEIGEYAYYFYEFADLATQRRIVAHINEKIKNGSVRDLYFAIKLGIPARLKIIDDADKRIHAYCIAETITIRIDGLSI